MQHVKVVFGLIGFPLGHSWSAGWFNEKFRSEGEINKEYHLFPLTNISELPGLLTSVPALAGLNVTIPYKEKILPLLDELDETARSVGAVNVIRIERAAGKIRTKGFNTDARGFLMTLPEVFPFKSALILGTGGAAKAVAWALRKKNIPFLMVSRKNKGKYLIAYDDISPGIIRNNLLIINATPLGMFPDTEKYPGIPYHYLTGDHFLYDLIYNPEETAFLKQGKAMNACTMNGMQMLINQAVLSWNIFKGND